MATLGPRALIDIAGLGNTTGLDAATILAFQMRDGAGAEQVIAEAATAIGVVNERLMAQYGGLLFQTESLHARYRQGGSNHMTPRAVEFVPADARRADMVGHMLFMEGYEDALAWTRRYLRDANMEMVRADVQSVADAWEDRVDYEIIWRMLRTDERQIGESGYAPGWAIGTGTNVDFIPPQWRGYTFDSTHTHYIYVDSSGDSNHATLLNDMMEELRHHGHTGRLACFVSQVDLSSYMALEKFVELKPGMINVITGGDAQVRVSEGEVQGVPGEVFGYFNGELGVAELRYLPRIPTGYAFMTKVYGENNMRNGLALRVHPNLGFGLQVLPQVTTDLTPKLDRITFEADFGITANDRTNGVAGYIDDSASEYTEPTIT